MMNAASNAPLRREGIAQHEEMQPSIDVLEDDLLELIISYFKASHRLGGYGGLNRWRLVSKRCKRVAELCTTRLSAKDNMWQDEHQTLPVNIIQKCPRIIELSYMFGPQLRSLKGCPIGLKWLSIGLAPHLSDISPLASCTMMRVLNLNATIITDISVVASMPLLETFSCYKSEDAIQPSITDLSPLAFCLKLKEISITGNIEVQDLSPLSACIALEDLDISFCFRVKDLNPLSSLKELRKLDYRAIDAETSLLPLASCPGLKHLECDEEEVEGAMDLKELRRRKPRLKIVVRQLGPPLWPAEEEEEWLEGEEGEEEEWLEGEEGEEEEWLDGEEGEEEK